jgi:endosialidase-like protein
MTHSPSDNRSPLGTFVALGLCVALSGSVASGQDLHWHHLGNKLYWNADNVGLGTSSPAYTFDVRSSGVRAISVVNTATTGFTYGLYGISLSDRGRGVYGIANNTQGIGYGVYGVSNGRQGRGVFGFANDTTGGNSYGVYGKSKSTGGAAVFGEGVSSYGVYGQTAASHIGSNTGNNAVAGVRGVATATAAGGWSAGVWGISNGVGGNGIGVAGYQADSGFGVYGKVGNSAGWAGYFDGNVRVTGTVTENSRRDLKDEIEPMGDALDMVLLMNPVRYRWNEDSETSVRGLRDIGFIADEMAGVVPDVVRIDEDGEPGGIAYSKLTAVLAGAVQELQREIDQQQESLDRVNEENEKLRLVNEELRARLDRIEALLLNNQDK